MPKPCAGGSLAAFFHTHDEWTGMCGCGEGPFVKAEWRHHYLAVTASVGETVCDLDAERVGRPGLHANLPTAEPTNPDPQPTTEDA